MMCREEEGHQMDSACGCALHFQYAISAPTVTPSSSPLWPSPQLVPQSAGRSSVSDAKGGEGMAWGRPLGNTPPGGQSLSRGRYNQLQLSRRLLPTSPVG